VSYEQAGFGGRPTDERYPGRRQLQDLTADDLAAHAAWWFPPEDGHLTGPDACTVMPMDASAAGEGGACEFPSGRFLLRADFVLADGTATVGHVSYVAGETVDLTTQEPTLCVPAGQVPLWHGQTVPDGAFVARLLALAGRPREALFPLRWRATLHPTEFEITGEAAGFFVWRNGRVEPV
jgi:hypothetical protein